MPKNKPFSWKYRIFFFYLQKLLVFNMHQIAINDKLYDDLKSYCSINNLKITEFCKDTLEKALILAKFGDTPFMDYHKTQDNETVDTPIPEKKSPWVFGEDIPNAEDNQTYSVEINVNGNEYTQKARELKNKKRKLA